VVQRHNAVGKPLASAEWLDAHHQAKLPERKAFAELLAQRQPKRIVDLGCGPGLWLALMNETLPADCEFIGVDSDPDALTLAEARSHSWQRASRFECIDIDLDPASVPAGDLVLAFNIFPYLSDPSPIIQRVAAGRQTLAIRQYDGAALRFGPMDAELRGAIEASLSVAAIGSEQFRHYDMDRTFELISSAPFPSREIAFELFARTSPFPTEFRFYYEGMLSWTSDLLSENAADGLQAWVDEADERRYFFEVDLTAILS
jgi:SAM-dependent methyltransferase